MKSQEDLSLDRRSSVGCEIVLALVEQKNFTNCHGRPIANDSGKDELLEYCDSAG